ncbi:MAG: sugar kinase [Sphingobacteriales bacterium 50-39]|nr:ROK family protein [Sphingobacteriales bacterium]OJW55875.1 MAG: sugar kinase [Sphingobacteriales bacterium 50-39]
MRETKTQRIGEIFRHLYYSAPISCTSLSMKLGKSQPHTMARINELQRGGYIVETGHAPSTGGRKPQMYSLRPDLFYILSVALDQFVARIALLDLQNNFVVAPEKYELKLLNNSDALSELAEIIKEYIAAGGVEKEQIAGIGIGMPGFVEVNKGINYSISENRSVAGYISSTTGLPVYIENDSSSIALAEMKFGMARNVQNAMVLNIGWGVGLGLVVDGRLFRGSKGFAGEFSHIPLFENNKLCNCGKSGCLETESSLCVIVEKAIEGLSNGRLSSINPADLDREDLEKSFETIRAAAAKGDKFSVDLFSSAGYEIGRGLSILIHLLNPDLVVLSGRGSLAGRIWLPPIQQALNDHCIPRLFENTEIRLSQLGYDAELIGAAALVMERCEHLRLNPHVNYSH